MGKTSSVVKDRYNLKAYDEIKARVHKGNKAHLQAIADTVGESVNTFINKAIEERIKKEFPDAKYIFKYTDSE